MHSCPAGLPVSRRDRDGGLPDDASLLYTDCTLRASTRDAKSAPAAVWTLFRSQPAFRNETAAFRTKRDPSRRQPTCRRTSGALLALDADSQCPDRPTNARATDVRHDKRICDSDSDQRDTRGRDRCSRCARHADRGRQHRRYVLRVRRHVHARAVLPCRRRFGGDNGDVHVPRR